MAKNILKYRILTFTLLVMILISYTTKPTLAKYVYTETGRAMASLMSGKIFTEAFVLTNELFFDENGNPKESVTSDNLHGMSGEAIDLNNPEGSYTIDKNSNYSKYDLNSVAEKVFVVHNASDYDLVACFDVVICLGLSSYANPSLTLTITEQSSETKLTVTAQQGSTPPNGVNLKKHPEKGESGEGPIIDVQYGSIIGTNYSAFSAQVNPKDFKGTSKLSNEDFREFILVKSGESKTFTLSVNAKNTDILGLDRNAYASMTMTTVKYVE